MTENPPKKQRRKRDKFDRGAFYRVEWLDIQVDDGWVSLKGAKLGPAECITYGWCSEANVKGIRLSATLGDAKDGSDVEYNQHIFIPQGCIVAAEKVTAP